MELAMDNKLFSIVALLLLVCVPFLNGASVPVEEKNQDENNSTKIEFLNPESSKTEQSVNHQTAIETTTDWGNGEHNDGPTSMNLDGNTGPTTSQPFQTVQKSSVSKPTQGTTPIPLYIEIDDDQHTKIPTEISNAYNITTAVPPPLPPLENKLDEENLQPTVYEREDERVTTTLKTSSVKNDAFTFDVNNVTTTQIPDPVVNNLMAKDGHVKIKADQSSQESKPPVQKEVTANISSSIIQGEKGNNVNNQNATVNTDRFTNGNRSSTPSLQNDSVSEDVKNQDVEKVLLSNKDNETLLLDDLDDIISKRHYYTSSDFNGNTSHDINLNARDITEPTLSETQTSSKPTTLENVSETDITTESENIATSEIFKEEITSNAPSTPKSSKNIIVTEESTVPTTTTISTSSSSSTTTSTISSSPPSTNATQMPPSDKPDNNSPVHQFFMDLRAHTVLCLISLLLLLLGGTILFSFILAIVYSIKYCFIGIAKLFSGIKRCCPKRKKSSNSGFHESGSLFPRCDVSIRPYDPSNPNDRDMY